MPRKAQSDVATGSDVSAHKVDVSRFAVSSVVIATARMLAALALLISAAILVLRLGSPFTISAMAGTTTIVLHNPRHFRSRPHGILAGYLCGLLVAVPISLIGALIAAPGLVAAAVSAALIAGSATGRRHPPVTCIPLAVATAAGPGEVLAGWSLFAVTAGCWLALLWLLAAIGCTGAAPRLGAGSAPQGTTAPV